MPRTNRTRGVTLIETLIYLSLFVIVIGGLVSSAYGIFSSLERNTAHAMVRHETEFLLAKINWALGSASVLHSPLAGATSSMLVLTPYDLTLGSPITIDYANGEMRIRRGTPPREILNNTNVRIDDLTFTRTDAIHGTRVTAVISLSTLTADGKPLSYTATTTRYVRQ